MSDEISTLVVAQSAPTGGLLLPIASTAQMIERHNAMTAFLTEALKEGRDYGSIPGTGTGPDGKPRMTLLKPGAELILIGFGCVAVDEVIQSDAEHNAEIKYSLDKWVKADPPMIGNQQDKQMIEQLKAAGTHRWKKDGASWVWQEKINESGTSLGFYRYVVRTRIVNKATGETVGTGTGSCSTAESKYIRAPRDAENTVLKMASKRATIDAVLKTFGLSERFSQDMDELMENKAARSEAPVASPAIVEAPTEPKAKSPKELYIETHTSLNLPLFQEDKKFDELNKEMMGGLIGKDIKRFSTLRDEDWKELTTRLLEAEAAKIGDWKAAAAGVR